jgi:hypothetical protein
MSAHYEPTLTTVCRTDRHRHCTGCDCRCHHVPPPAGFRELVKALRGCTCAVRGCEHLAAVRAAIDPPREDQP